MRACLFISQCLSDVVNAELPFPTWPVSRKAGGRFSHPAVMDDDSMAQAKTVRQQRRLSQSAFVRWGVFAARV